jgi:hypothetical protein
VPSGLGCHDTGCWNSHKHRDISEDPQKRNIGAKVLNISKAIAALFLETNGGRKAEGYFSAVRLYHRSRSIEQIE